MTNNSNQKKARTSESHFSPQLPLKAQARWYIVFKDASDKPENESSTLEKWILWLPREPNNLNWNEFFNIFGTSLKARKTKIACKLCFYEAYVKRRRMYRYYEMVCRILLGENLKSSSKISVSLYFISFFGLKFFYIRVKSSTVAPWQRCNWAE